MRIYTERFYCDDCGASLWPVIKFSSLFDKHFGNRIYHVRVWCPNNRWWKIFSEHTDMMLQYGNYQECLDFVDEYRKHLQELVKKDDV